MLVDMTSSSQLGGQKIILMDVEKMSHIFTVKGAVCNF